MRIKIEKTKLFELLQKAYAFVPAKSSLQILSNIKISFNNGKLEVAATDLDHSIRVFTMIDGDGSFEITVNARKVYDIVREIHDGQITITKDENVLIMESESGFSCKIAGTDSGSFPGFPEIKVDQECTIPVAQFKTMVIKSSFAVAKDDSRAVLCGVLLEVEPKKISMVSTDGHRLGCCWYQHNQTIEEKITVIVYPKSLTNLVASLNQDDTSITMTISEKYVVFTTKNFVLYTKRIEGDYPDYGKVIPKNNPKKAVIEKEVLVNAVKRVSILSNQKTHLVKFVFKVGELEITVLNRDIGGEARDLVPADYTGEEFTIGFNALYFCEIVNILDTPKVRMEMNTQISACMLYPEYEKEKEASRSNDILLIMPLRIMEENG